MRHAYHSPIEHLILATRCSIFCGLSALGFVSLQHGERPGIDRPRNTTRQVQRSVTLSGGGRLHRKLGSAQHPKCGESGTRGEAPSPAHLSSHGLRRSKDNSRSRVCSERSFRRALTCHEGPHDGMFRAQELDESREQSAVPSNARCGMRMEARSCGPGVPRAHVLPRKVNGRPGAR